MCGVRSYREGKLISLNYGLVSSIAVDPIEKKPLKFFMPGSFILSIGSVGCNFKCGFCQNCDISMEFDKSLSKYGTYTPSEIVDLTKASGLKSIAYTYNEPTVFYEMVYETALLAHQEGLLNVLVTNGYINEEPFQLIAPYVDAMNIDVKTYDKNLYQSVCKGEMEDVLRTICLARKAGIHVELTCLIVPKLFSDLSQLPSFFKMLSEISLDAPIFISRYFPRYQWEEEATDIMLMLKIQEIAQCYFTNVLLGNVR
jgi:pyruvate formate lyase activating enzyme